MKLKRIDFCTYPWGWSWIPRKHVFYSGNQIALTWWRLTLIFERSEWKWIIAAVKAELTIAKDALERISIESAPYPGPACRYAMDALERMEKKPEAT